MTSSLLQWSLGKWWWVIISGPPPPLPTYGPVYFSNEAFSFLATEEKAQPFFSMWVLPTDISIACSSFLAKNIYQKYWLHSSFCVFLIKQHLVVKGFFMHWSVCDGVHCAALCIVLTFLQLLFVASTAVVEVSNSTNSLFLMWCVRKRAHSLHSLFSSFLLYRNETGAWRLDVWRQENCQQSASQTQR